MKIKIHDLESIDFAISRIFKNPIPVISNRKRKCKSQKFYLKCGGGYDTETTTIKHSEIKNGIEYMRPDFAYVYHFQFMINGVYIYGRFIDDITPFFASLLNRIKKDYPGARLIIWVANISFEWAFMKKQLSKLNITKVFAKSKRRLLYIELDNVIELRECIGLFGYSLENIANNFTTTKKLKNDLDYNLIRTPYTRIKGHEALYMYNDVKILDELSFVAFKMFTDRYIDIPLTSTGIIRQECKKGIKNILFEYEKNEKLMPLDYETYDIFRRYLYAGGYAHGNYNMSGITIENVRCADLTSDYPAQMRHKKFPSGELLELTATENCFSEKHVSYIGKVRLYGVRAKTAHTFISKNKIYNSDTEWNSCIFDNGRLIQGDNIVLFLNEIDWKNVNTMYEIEKYFIEKAWYFTKQSKIPKFLSNVIDKYYLIKEDLKSKGLDNTIEYILAKRNVNGIYGMTATKVFLNEYVFDAEICDIKEINKKNYDDLRKKVWLNPYIGYWTTSYARSILCYFISKYQDLIIQYDTDSLYFKEECAEELKKEIDNYNAKITMKNHNIFSDKHFLKLGTWDLSKPIKKFKGLGAKRYVYDDGEKIKTVIAGCNSKSLVKYCNKQGKDVFEYFNHLMLLRCADSDKLTVSFYDGDIMLKKVTDYKGRTDIVEVGTYAALFEIPFRMKLTDDYIALIEQIKKYGGLNEFTL